MKVNQEVNITMKFYKNNSVSSKTFHDVTFGPGETKGVNGNINDPKMVRVSGPVVDKKKVAPIAQKGAQPEAGVKAQRSVTEVKKPVEAEKKGDKE